MEMISKNPNVPVDNIMYMAINFYSIVFFNIYFSKRIYFLELFQMKVFKDKKRKEKTLGLPQRLGFEITIMTMW